MNASLPNRVCFRRSALLVGLGLSGLVGPLSAQTMIDWRNDAPGTAWATGSNWVGGSAPADDLTTNIARFNQTSYLRQPNAGTRSIAGIQVGDGVTSTAALTISGTALTIGGSGVTLAANAGDAEISASIALGANQVWDTAAGTTLTTTSVPIAGSYSLEKTGAGTLRIGGGTSTFSGGFTLTAGTVRVNSNTAFGTGTLALNGGVVSTTGASARSLSNAVTLGGDVQLGDTGFNGLVTYNGTLTVSGNRQITFVNTGGALAGGVTLNGNLTLSTAMATPVSGNQIAGDIDGSYGLVKTGTGLFQLSGSNSYGGGTQVNAGELWVGSTDALGTGIVSFGGGKLDLRGQNLVVNALDGSSGTISDTASAGTRTLTIGQGGGSGTFGGTISQSTATKIIALTKTGAGTQTFTGNNTYIGQTVVSQGTLRINGTHVDASASSGIVNGYGSTSTGHFQVESGATLGGTGRIQGNTSQANSNLVLVKSNGILAPGASIGTLVLDGNSLAGTGSRVLNMQTDAVFAFELAGDGTAADQVNFWNYATSDVLLNDNAINLTLDGTAVAGTYTVDLFAFYSDSGSTATASGISSGLTIGTLGAGIDSASLSYNTNTISLSYTVVPEPATSLLLAAGLVAVVVFRRRPHAGTR